MSVIAFRQRPRSAPHKTGAGVLLTPRLQGSPPVMAITQNDSITLVPSDQTQMVTALAEWGDGAIEALMMAGEVVLRERIEARSVIRERHVA